MSKTNHRRGHVKKRYSLGQQTGRWGFVTFNGGRTTMDGKRINASSTVASENSKQVRRDRAGAKKFIASRTRFHDRMACDKIVREGLQE